MKTVLSWFVAVGAVVAGVCAGANVSAPGGDPSVREDLDTLTETVSAQGASLLSEIRRVDEGLLSLAFHFTEHAAAGALELVDGYLSTFGDSTDDVSSVLGMVWSGSGWTAAERLAFANGRQFWVQLPYESVPAYGGADNFSVSCWVRPTATDIAQADGQACVMRHATGNSGFSFGIANGVPSFFIDGRGAGGDAYASVSASAALPTNTWSLLVGSWVCTDLAPENPGVYSNVTSLYVDGVLVDAVTNEGSGKDFFYPAGSAPYLAVGGSAYEYNEDPFNSVSLIFDGRVAQAVVWSSVLDDAAVAALYNSGVGVSEVAENGVSGVSPVIVIDGTGTTVAVVSGSPVETVTRGPSAGPASAEYGGFIPSAAATLTSEAYPLLSSPDRLRVGAWLLGDSAGLSELIFAVSTDGGAHFSEVPMVRTASLLDGTHYFASGVTTNFVAGTSLIMQMQSGGNDVTLRGWSRQAD